MAKHTQSMALRDKMEIYIPVEAEVKSIPLCSLPNSILRRMGLPLFHSDSKKLTDSLKGIWICPAVIRRKGQKLVSHTEKDVKEDMVSLLDREFQAESGSYRMSFVSSNRTAYKVLKDTMPGNMVSAHTSNSALPQGSSPQTLRDAVVIYNGQIYLSMRNPNRSQSQRKTCSPKPASQCFGPSTSDLSSQSQKKLSADNKPKKKQITCKVTHGENKEGVTQKVRAVSSSTTAHSVPQSSDSAHSMGDRYVRVEQTTEEATIQEPDRFQPQEEQEQGANSDSGECEMQDLGSEEAESIDHIIDMNRNMHIDNSEGDQSSSQSSTRREPLGAACSSTSLQNEFDFKELAEEEMIAQMKARFKAALCDLNLS